VTGVWRNGTLTLWTDTEFTRSMLNKDAIVKGLTEAATACFGVPARVSVVTGKPPAAEPAPPAPQEDKLDELLAFSAGFDNIIIQ